MRGVKRDGWWRSVQAGLLMTLSLSACITVGPATTPSPSVGVTAEGTPSPASTATSTPAPTGTALTTATSDPTPSAPPAPTASASPSSIAPPPTSSVAPTSSPSATPAGDGFGAITPIFQDDFLDTPSGWGIGERENGAIGYGEGQLRVDLTTPTAGLWSTRLLDANWEVVQVEGTVQPLAEAAPARNGYAGFLCAAGQRDYFMGIIDTRGGWVFAESVDTAVTVLARGGPPPPALSGGAGSRLTMQCAGSATGAVRLRLLVGGTEVGRFEREDGLGRFDQVGVYGEAVDPTFSFTVDDVDVWGGPVFVAPPRPSSRP